MLSLLKIFKKIFLLIYEAQRLNYFEFKSEGGNNSKK